jgi:hypothetical protein
MQRKVDLAVRRHSARQAHAVHLRKRYAYSGSQLLKACSRVHSRVVQEGSICQVAGMSCTVAHSV